MEAQEFGVRDRKKHRSILIRLLGKMTLYYVVLAAIVALANAVSPAFVQQFPVGGLDQIANYYETNAGDLENALLTADEEELENITSRMKQSGESRGPIWYHSAKSLFFAMISALILMVPVSWVYKSIHDQNLSDHSLDETTLILPAVVAGIVTVVQHSLALAFSLAGIVAGVQFRRALSDTFDTLFIFVAIGVGIAAGINSVEIAVVMTVFFNYASIFVCLFGDGLESQHRARGKALRHERKLARKQVDSSPEQP